MLDNLKDQSDFLADVLSVNQCWGNLKDEQFLKNTNIIGIFGAEGLKHELQKAEILYDQVYRNSETFNPSFLLKR